METMLRELAEACRKCGLKMNMSKTKALKNPLEPHGEIIRNGNQKEDVKEYMYRAQSLSLKEK